MHQSIRRVGPETGTPPWRYAMGGWLSTSRTARESVAPPPELLQESNGALRRARTGQDAKSQTVKENAPSALVTQNATPSARRAVGSPSMESYVLVPRKRLAPMPAPIVKCRAGPSSQL